MHSRVTQDEKDFIAEMFKSEAMLSQAQRRALTKLQDGTWHSAMQLHEPADTLNRLVKLGLAETRRPMSNGIGDVPHLMYRLIP